jgi:hypothetical protein
MGWLGEIQSKTDNLDLIDGQSCSSCPAPPFPQSLKAESQKVCLARTTFDPWECSLTAPQPAFSSDIVS